MANILIAVTSRRCLTNFVHMKAVDLNKTESDWSGLRQEEPNG